MFSEKDVTIIVYAVVFVKELGLEKTEEMIQESMPKNTKRQKKIITLFRQLLKETAEMNKAQIKEVK